MNSFLIGGTHSGVGKTTISIALMAAFKKRGLNIQPFKVGPDYIDPAYHEKVTGTPSINLDSWLLSESFIRETFHRHASGQDAAIVEGVMGLFDGFSGTEEIGSSAHIAKIINLPVILVIDAYAMVRSAAALAKGFASLDPELEVVGVIFNRVASPQHFQWLKDAVQKWAGMHVFGYLPNNPALKIPERHLGLTSVREQNLPDGFVDRLVQTAEQFIDIDQILNLPLSQTPRSGAWQSKSSEIASIPLSMLSRHDKPIRIGVAYDRAFCFYYHDNFNLLKSAGAELVFFSPVSGDFLPDALDSLYLGGGFPELFAYELAEAEQLKNQIRLFAAEGKPVYAECGGLMFLMEELVDTKGISYPMTGVIPGRVVMAEKLQACGYREVKALTDSILAQKGEILKGHEFHWSRTEGIPIEKTAYEFQNQPMGYAEHGVLASYLHLHFGTNPHWIETWFSHCLRSVAVKGH